MPSVKALTIAGAMTLAGPLLGACSESLGPTTYQEFPAHVMDKQVLLTEVDQANTRIPLHLFTVALALAHPGPVGEVHLLDDPIHDTYVITSTPHGVDRGMTAAPNRPDCELTAKQKSVEAEFAKTKRLVLVVGDTALVLTLGSDGSTESFTERRGDLPILTSAFVGTCAQINASQGLKS